MAQMRQPVIPRPLRWRTWEMGRHLFMLAIQPNFSKAYIRLCSLSGSFSNDANCNHSIRPQLKERHTNMIAFSTVVGIGFFLQSGRVIYLAGPGLAWIAYILMGTVLWSAIASLGEMTALLPVKGAVFEFPRRFCDAGIGCACGWMSW